MSFDKNKLLLYAITDRAMLGGKTLSEAVERALKGGAAMIQLRDKGADVVSLTKTALKLKPVCEKYGAPLIINDSIEAALASGADGVHLGQGDAPIEEARKILGADKIIGATARTPEQAIAAEKAGADYLGSGAVFGTSTKPDAVKMSGETLRLITSSVNIPVAAIGGITAENILELKNTGIAGAAVVSGIFAQPDIEKAAKNLAALAKEVIG